MVGWSLIGEGTVHAFRWQNGIIQSLGTLGGEASYAYGVSADGSVVVGFSKDLYGRDRAFKWTEQTGMQDLGTLGGDHSYAYDVSANGSVIVGASHTRDWLYRACLWEHGIIRDLGTLGGLASFANAVSADGRKIVGYSYPANSAHYHAFLWDSGVMQDLGRLDDENSFATGISADGSVIVGWLGTERFGVPRAFVVVQSTSIRDIGSPAVAFAASEDGLVIVGSKVYTNPAGTSAVRWMYDRASGLYRIQDLNSVYEDLLTDGSILLTAVSVSPNGRYIVGYGYNAATRRYEGYLLDTGAPPITGDVNRDGCVDDADLLSVLFSFGRSGANLPEDVGGDGVVDDADLLTVLFNFGVGC